MINLGYISRQAPFQKLFKINLCPFLIDLEITELPQGPLTQFQARTASRQGTWELLLSLNNALDEKKLDEERLARSFEAHWPSLEAIINDLPADKPSIKRSSGDMTEEVLQIVRDNKRVINELASIRSTAVSFDDVVNAIQDLDSRITKISSFLFNESSEPVVSSNSNRKNESKWFQPRPIDESK